MSVEEHLVKSVFTWFYAYTLKADLLAPADLSLRWSSLGRSLTSVSWASTAIEMATRLGFIIRMFTADCTRCFVSKLVLDLNYVWICLLAASMNFSSVWVYIVVFKSVVAITCFIVWFKGFESTGCFLKKRSMPSLTRSRGVCPPLFLNGLFTKFSVIWIAFPGYLLLRCLKANTDFYYRAFSFLSLTSFS